MDPELTEAELVTLNKIVDDVEKLNKQLQRFVESSRIQAAYKAPSMEEKLERIMERLAKMMPTPKSESDAGADDLSVAENSNDDNESEIVAVTDTEVISSIVSVEYSSGLVLDHVKMDEGNLETELCLSNSILAAYLLPVCENASVYLHSFLLEHMEDDDIAEEGEKFDSEPSIEALKNSVNFCIQAIRQNASKVMVLYLPPAKPPDDILNGLQDARKTILSYFDMLRDLIGGSRTLWHWSYIHILLVCPPLPPDMTRYLIIFGSVLTGIDVVIQWCLGLDDFTVVSRFGYHGLCIFGGIRQIQNKDYYWVLAFFRGKMQLSWNCVNLLIPGLGLAALPSSSLWRLLIFSVWSSLNINAMQDPNIGVILFCAQNLFEQSDGYCAQPNIKKFIETAIGANLNMIGQSGVESYFVYFAGEKVIVTAKHNVEEQYVWVSHVSGSFTMARDISCENLDRRIKIILFIKVDQHQLEFLVERELEDLIKHSELIGAFNRMCMTNLGSYYHEKRLDFGHNDDLYGDIGVSSLCGVFGYGKPAAIEDIAILWKDKKVHVAYQGSSLVVVSDVGTSVKIKVDSCEGRGYRVWISYTVLGLQVWLKNENFKESLMANLQASHSIAWSASYKFSDENSWLLGIYLWDLHFWDHFSFLIIKRSSQGTSKQESGFSNLMVGS